MMDRPFRRIGLIGLTLLAFAPAALHARIFVVTRTADTNDGVCDRRCSLREAIMAANQSPGPDTVFLFQGVYRLALPGADEDLGATGDLDITDDLTLVGVGAGATILDGAGLDRVLDVHAPADVQIFHLTLRGGKSTRQIPGGGIRNAGRLALAGCAISGNSTTDFGFGGGIYSADPGSALTLDLSTVSGNTADGGGGGLAIGGLLTVTNSTISGNRSVTDFGGGVYLFSDSVASFNNVTITANTAARTGGGLFVELPDQAGTPRIANSIVAANSASMSPDCLGVELSGGYNLIGESESCPGFKASAGDLTGTAASPLDPRLGPLAAPPGLAPSHPLLADSPAVNAGNPLRPGSGGGACERIDQRNVVRRHTRCDIGSFERKATR